MTVVDQMSVQIPQTQMISGDGVPLSLEDSLVSSNPLCDRPDLVLSKASVIYEALLTSMRGERVLTPLHWLLIKRACYHFILAENGFPRSDTALAQLLTEPLRALRANDVLVERIQKQIVEVLKHVLPADKLAEAAGMLDNLAKATEGS